jgi:AraC-like DNA-binding protein
MEHGATRDGDGWSLPGAQAMASVAVFAGADRGAPWEPPRSPVDLASRGEVRLIRPVQVTQASLMQRCRPDEIILLAVFAGALDVNSRALRGAMGPGDVMVLGEPGVTELAFSAEADIAQVVIPRRLWAAAPLGDRAAPDVILPDTPLRALLSALIGAVSEPRMRDALGRNAVLNGAAEYLLVMSLAEALAAWSAEAGRGARPALLPGPLKRAIDYIRANAISECDVETLASIAGVSSRSLRRSFLDVLGKTATRYLRETRLGLARERLEDSCEPRSAQAIAKAVGFGNYTSFWRAYDELYGENPSETRARVFRRSRAVT